MVFRLIICVFFLSLIIPDKVTAQQPELLKINGKVYSGNKKDALKDAEIKVFLNSKKQTSVKSDAGGIFSVSVNFQKEYVIEVGLPEYDKYIFIFSSVIPAAEISNNKSVDIEIPLEKLKPGMNNTNIPVAKILYDKSQKKFRFDPDYKPKDITTTANKDSDDNNRKYDALVANGLKLFKSKQYEKSKAEFQKALKIKPDEKFPKSKINEIDKFLAEDPKQLQNKPDTTGDNSTQQVITSLINENQARMLEDYLDSLETIEKSGKESEAAGLLKEIGNIYLEQKNTAKALEYFDRALKTELQSGDLSGASEMYNGMAVAHYEAGDYEMSIDNYKDALNIKQDIGDKDGAAKILNTLGILNENLYRYDRAIDFYSKSLEINEELKDTSAINELVSAIGDAYYNQKNYPKSIEYYLKSLDIEKKTDQKDKIAGTLNNLGVIYYKMGDYGSALDFYEKSLEEVGKLGKKKEMAMTYNNLGNVNYDLNKYDNALDYYEKSLELKEEIDYKNGIALSLHNIGNVHKELKNNDKAIEYYSESNKVAEEIDNAEIITLNYKGLSEVYVALHNCEKAFGYYKLFASSRYASLNKEEVGQLSEMQDKFGSGKTPTLREIASLKEELQKQKVLAQIEASMQEKEIQIIGKELQRKEEAIKRQRILTYSLISGILLTILFSILILRQFVQKKRANRLLVLKNIEIQKKNEEITMQRDEIEAHRDVVVQQKNFIENQKKEITDSITYANRIQQALLPDLKHILSRQSAVSGQQLTTGMEIADCGLKTADYFVLYKPKDIVSGDFYWATRINEWLIFTVADCTGHGVPGAFMSMLGISFLNEIVRKKEVTKASQVLDHLREYIIEVLHQKTQYEFSSEYMKDGMDIALCALNTKDNVLQYSGAYNPLYLVTGCSSLVTGEANQKPATRNQQLIELKADKQPVAIYHKMNPFTNHEIVVQKGDMIYLVSDGFEDQFGGQSNRKIMAKQLKELLTGIADKPMNEQKETLNSFFENWKGESEQIDDITILGVRV